MNNRRLLFSFSAAQAILVSLGALAVSAHGAEPTPNGDCDGLLLDSGPLSQALKKFSAETDISIVVDHRLIEGRTAPAVATMSDCVGALSAIVSNAGLVVQRVNDATFVIAEPKPKSNPAPLRIPSIPMHTEVTRPHDEIIVTGSRLFLADFKSITPTISLEASEINRRGVARVEDLINILPQAFAVQTSELANGSTGTSSLDLRGLGEVRTLVLLDGRRLPYGSPTTSPVNLDIIPAQLVERVDIVTGGASAVYGSDAVSGVANFILKRDYEGVEVDGQVGFFQDSNNNEFVNALLDNFNIDRPSGGLDGRGVNVSALFGANTDDGRGNVTAFVQYQDQNEIRQSARDYTACSFSTSQSDPRSIGGIACGGSSTFRRIGIVNSNPNFPAGLFLAEDGTLAPFTGVPEQLFNFAPDNFIQRNNERFNISAFARYEVVDEVEAYLDLGFTENTTDAQVAFSGTFFRDFQINCDNPFLQALVPGGGTLAEAGLGCTPAQATTGRNPDGTQADVNFGGVRGPGYRNVNGEPRSTATALATLRIVGGFRGTIDNNWHWDAFGQFSRTRMNRQSTGDVNFEKAQDAFFVVTDPMTGQPVCRSGNQGCLPLNIFQRPGGVDPVTPEVAQSIQGNGFVTGTVEQIVLGATIGGDLGGFGFRFPWTESGVRSLVGFEYREDRLERTPDDISQIPGGLGLTGITGAALPVSGEVNVWEVFTETQIPLIEGKPLFQDLAINGAYRYSSYTAVGEVIENSFDTNTFSVGFSWAPIKDIRFRSQFQRAVRAPNVIELFTGQNLGLFGAPDPCAGDFEPATLAPEPTATAAQCAFTGVSAAQYGAVPFNTANQLSAITGGNPFLNPEKANTYTAGVIFQPIWFDKLTVAIDYFDITVNDAVTRIPPTTTLNQCLTTGDPSFCSLITRDSFGTLFVSGFVNENNPVGISTINTNIAELSTRGVDFISNYSQDVGGLGVLNLDFIATYLFENSFIAIQDVTEKVECVGFYSGLCVRPIPIYRHRLLTTWQTPWDVDISATWRHFGGVKNANNFGSNYKPPNILDGALDSANYLDLSAQWYVRENVTLRAGVQNVLGRDPELQTIIQVAPGNGNTFPGTYDPTGRFIFFGVNVRL